MIRRADVYSGRGLLLVSSLARTRAGFWISWPPFLSLGEDSADYELGVAACEAVEASVLDVKTPPRDAKPFAPMLELAGFSSFGVFMRGTVSVGISEESGLVTVTPTRNAGPRGGFVEMVERACEAFEPSSVELGLAVRSALARPE